MALAVSFLLGRDVQGKRHCAISVAGPTMLLILCFRPSFGTCLTLSRVRITITL